MVNLAHDLAVDADLNEPYACPDARVPLQRIGDELISPATGRRFIISRGIPQFLRYVPVEDAESAARLARLNRLAEEEGWRVALEKSWPDVLRYVTDERRASYIGLLPLTAESRVLEIGAGLGQHTCILARRARSVHALEVVPAQALFIAQRCREVGIRNVSVACGGDDCALPYSGRSFDVVVANLVLEWCGSRACGDRPEDAQNRLLAEAHRVLKPGGVFYVATKNRYALTYLLGGRDEHVNGMRFGNALPRPLMRLCRPVMKKKATGMLHSYSGLRGMLAFAGFNRIQSYWPVPDIRCPDRYISTDRDSVRAALRDPTAAVGTPRLSRIIRLLPPSLIKHVAHGLVFVAWKQSA
ncbi:MAG TPA: class I SAM-dependent methyltransferase [Phycisphaerae bacterium]|nr:class I SAM-dependent methyltransferase [Phycisphaerae bacterium]HUW32471.1 class I SAM-dependent methyltransferase [Planctomycetota bacterium]